LPGQWLDTYVPGITKAGGFTITSPPSAASAGLCEPHLELAIQKSPENAVAAWLWQPEESIMGANLQVRVGGGFVFPPPSFRLNDMTTVVFIAGGVGINPLMSMISHIGEANDFPNLQVFVFYASKMPHQGGLENILFVPRIAALFANSRITGQFNMFLTGSAGGRQLLSPSRRAPPFLDSVVAVHEGRLSMADLGQVLRGRDSHSSVFYICGPPAMTDSLSESLCSESSELCASPDQIMTEKWW
jgi:NAD(P)H-flavin reductase